MNITILVILLVSLAIGAIVLAIVVNSTLKKSDSIELVQGKLENTDLSIAKAMSYLEITNEWSK